MLEYVKFHYDYIKIKYGKYYSVLSIIVAPFVVVITTAQLHPSKPKLRICAGPNPARGVSKTAVKIKLDFSNYSAELKYYDDSDKLAVGKMKDETGGVTIKEFVGLKPTMYSFFVDDNSEYKKVNDVNKNVVSTINPDEYKDVL